MSGRLQDRVAFITGGGSGLGRAAALRFAREGALVSVVDVSEAGGQETARLIEAAGGRGWFLRADVTREAEVAAAVQATHQRHGRVDVLVACAGVPGPAGPISQVNADDWDAVMAVNVKGVYLAAKHCIPHMQAQGGGRIVVIASDSSFVAAPNMAAYCASKGAVLMLVRALAVDHGKDNICVNCVCPSIVDTPMVRREVGASPTDDLAQFGLDQVHRPEDVVNHLLFLASDEATNMNGAALMVDFGGLARSTFPF